ncbi:MAG: glycyl-radical enzyme activating protein [Spirochaetota bacterium]
MSSGLVFDIRKFSIHDGPGIRTAVFLKGCPLACPWCHNPEGRDGRPALLRRFARCVHCGDCARFCPLALDPKKDAGSAACRDCESFGACAEACPAEAIQAVGDCMTAEEIMTAIREDRPFYHESGGAATFTGGEPLAQATILGELLDACRAEGIHSAVETSGYARRETLLDIGSRADLLLFDLKMADAERGSAMLGIDYSICLGNLEASAQAAACAGSGFAEIIVRIPIVPGWTDAPGDLEAAAELVAALGHLPVHLLPYHDSAKGKYRLWGLEYRLSETAVPDEAAMAAALGIFTSRGIAARIGG